MMTHSILLNLSPLDFPLLKECAARSRKSMSEYLRRALRAQAVRDGYAEATTYPVLQIDGLPAMKPVTAKPAVEYVRQVGPWSGPRSPLLPPLVIVDGLVVPAKPEPDYL